MQNRSSSPVILFGRSTVYKSVPLQKGTQAPFSNTSVVLRRGTLNLTRRRMELTVFLTNTSGNQLTRRVLRGDPHSGELSEAFREFWNAVRELSGAVRELSEGF